jgi:hypothetical protein
MFTEDLSIFLEDFGVSCTAGAVSALGILDMPGETVSGGMVISTEYMLTAKASDFGSLLYGDSITVNGQSYQVREVLLLDDGKFCQLALTLISAVVELSRFLLEDGSFLLLEDVGYLLLES